MEDEGSFCGYEKRELSGKIKGERKSSASAAKGVEKKISCLLKKISKLENQRGNCYENLFKVKKKIYNQTNQIIKCFRERERSLLCEADEAFTSQISSINNELAKLISTHSACQALYANVQHLNGNSDVFSKINEYLSTINFQDVAPKPLKFTSNFEQAKTDAANYGCLEGDFVRQNIPEDSNKDAASAQEVKNNENQDSPCKFCHLNAMQSMELPSKVTGRKRTDSQDSFEIVDMLNDVDCLEDEKFSKSNRNQNCKNVAEDRHNVLGLPEKTKPAYAPQYFAFERQLSENTEPAYAPQYSAFERQLSELQSRLKDLNTSALNHVPNLENKNKTKNEIILIKDKETWLNRGPLSSNPKKGNGRMQLLHSKNDGPDSPAALIRKGFSPYFANDSYESWLSK